MVRTANKISLKNQRRKKICSCLSLAITQLTLNCHREMKISQTEFTRWIRFFLLFICLETLPCLIV